MALEYKDYKASADFISDKIKMKPDVAIIAGSGLGDIVQKIKDPIVIKYADIPGFPVSTVSYQAGELWCGYIEDKAVVVMNGRFHYYEGWEMYETVYPIYVFKIMGIEKLIVSNASGAINTSFDIGGITVVYDHIKLCAESPVRGKNIPEFGKRFFDMQTVYDKEYIAIAKREAQKLGFELKDAVYAYMAGPQYETPTEIKMLKTLGADVVGMSTVPEMIAAAHCGIRALCISVCTNMAAGLSEEKPDEDEVVVNAQKAKERFVGLITNVLKEI